MPTEEEKDRAKKGIRARQDAVAELIRRHQEEFDGLHRSNRIALGLSPRPSGPTPEQLRKRQERLEAQLEKVRRELSQAT